jgi:DNA-directed RNA polymerase specialized sigma24 family protein
MTNSTTATLTFATTEEMDKFIFTEVKRVANRQTAGRYFDASDLESYLMVRVWNEITVNPHLQNEAGIRRVTKLRSIDFFKSPKNNHRDYSNFSALSASDNEGNEQAFEETFNSGSASIDDTVIDGNLGDAFLATLSDKHRQILELKIDGFDIKEIASIVFPELSYESSRKSVRRNLQAITELALDFGLEEI